MTLRTSLSEACRSLLGDRNGNFSIMAAFAVPVIIVAAGSAVDFSVAQSQRTNLQLIADSAALAGGRVFDGTNLEEAKPVVVKFLEAQLGPSATEKKDGAAEPKVNEIKYAIATQDRKLNVTIQKLVPTTLMQIAAVNSVNVAVSATALSPLKPEKMTFTPTKAQGWYFKKITILVTRPGATTETPLGTVVYQPTTRNDGGQGTYVANPTGTIDLGKYTNLALRMDIKNDGCDIGFKVSVDSKNNVTCNVSTTSSDLKYSRVLRTDDPATSNYLFVDGKQVPAGIKASLEKYFGCTKKQEHAWEDGGGWDRQDFFYTVTSTCGADGEFVRLTN